jgi:hypothetical protein
MRDGRTAKLRFVHRGFGNHARPVTLRAGFAHRRAVIHQSVTLAQVRVSVNGKRGDFVTTA